MELPPAVLGSPVAEPPLRRTLVPALVALAMTAAFRWMVGLAAGAYAVWSAAQAGFTPTWASALAVQAALPYPLHAIFMQSLAAAALVANSAWALARLRDSTFADPVLLPLACHVAVVVGCLCLAGASMLSPLVETAAVLR